MSTEPSTTSPSEATLSAGARRVELVAIGVVLAAACTQWALGGYVDDTGEQQGLRLPLATLVQVLGLVVIVINRRRHLPATVPTWPHAAVLAAFCLGLLGLSRAELTSAAKELVQLGEILVIAWFLGATVARTRLPAFAAVAGGIGGGLLVLGPGHGYEWLHLSNARWAGICVLALPFLVYTLRHRPRALALALLPAGMLAGLAFENGGLLLCWALVCLAAVGLLTARRLWWTGIAAAGLALAATVVAPAPSAWDTLDPAYDAHHRKRLFTEYRVALRAPAHYPAGGGLGAYNEVIEPLAYDQEIAEDNNKVPTDSNSQYLVTLVEAGLPAAVLLPLLILGLIYMQCRRQDGDTAADDHHTRRLATALLLALLLAGLFTTTLGRGIGIWTGLVLGLATPRLQRRWRPALPPLLRRLALPAVAAVACAAVMLLVNRDLDERYHRSRVNRRLLAAVGSDLVKTTTTHDKGAEDGGDDNGQLQVFVLSDDGVTGADDGARRVEAETAAETYGAAKVITATDASGEQALSIPNGDKKAAAGARYTVDIETAGDYIIRARVWWTDGCSNSLGFELGGSYQKVSSAIYKKWHDCKTPRPVHLEAGGHTLHLKKTEGGVRLDYFTLDRVAD